MFSEKCVGIDSCVEPLLFIYLIVVIKGGCVKCFSPLLALVHLSNKNQEPLCLCLSWISQVQSGSQVLDL